MLLSGSVLAQHFGGDHQPTPQHETTHETSRHDHDHAGQAGSGWEGSPEGKAYSEFNHHVAGVFVLLIGLSEFREALVVGMLAWTRFLLPIAMLGAGSFFIIWSDHDAWPIGSLGFAQTFFDGDPETLQHKLYAVLLLTVGAIELLRRTGRMAQAFWTVPLPTFAVIGGLMLFLHSHGAHPAAHKIALHHAVMGIMAITAGSCKLASGWTIQPTASAVGSTLQTGPGGSRWGMAWAGFILLIGVQLLVYSE
ncbi:MAG: hypothetical protein HY581_07060 [Nitrospirae bacterium]|nr:hypothetical protein [Nitrospirota bacterium]